MTSLMQSLPSITATSFSCPQCGKLMDIKLVEPHLTVSKKEKHTFQCSECGLPKTYDIEHRTPAWRFDACRALGATGDRPLSPAFTMARAFRDSG
jgi:predicted RNA-binding Zn-ribbon protein involved in translation (DUF1610 family)